jgi:hypothetical protein
MPPELKSRFEVELQNAARQSSTIQKSPERSQNQSLYNDEFWREPENDDDDKKKDGRISPTKDYPFF